MTTPDRTTQAEWVAQQVADYLNSFPGFIIRPIGRGYAIEVASSTGDLDWATLTVERGKWTV
jgi:hypothetical protein